MRAFAPALLVSLSCCGEEEPPPVQPIPRITVRFEYRASTTYDPQIAEEFMRCVEDAGGTHIHPSWQSYDAVFFMREGPELWALTFDDVPIGMRAIRVSDPNACATHRTGAVTAHLVYANGVLLTQLYGTPGVGVEPGFSFTAEEDGTIVP